MFVALPSIPLPITPLFGESSSCGSLYELMKYQVSTDESNPINDSDHIQGPDCLWGSADSESGSVMMRGMITSSVQIIPNTYLKSRIELTIS